MTRPLLFLCILMVCLCGCGLGGSFLNEIVLSEKELKIGEFRHLSISGFGEYKVNCGKPASLFIFGENQLLSLITISQDAPKEELQIAFKTSSHKWEGVANGTISVQQLNSVSLDGPVRMEISEIESPRLDVKLEGQSNLNLYGVVEVLSVLAEGKSAFSAGNSVGVFVPDQPFQMFGKPTQREPEVIRRYFHCKKAKVVCSGQSFVGIHVTDEIEVEASGDSTVIIAGNPLVKSIKTSGKAKVVQK